MFRILCRDEKEKARLLEVARLFGPADLFDIRFGEDLEADMVLLSSDSDENRAALWRVLRDATGKEPDWGILTGVRPAKLYRLLGDEAEEVLRRRFLVSEPKIGLLRDVCSVQDGMAFDRSPQAIGVYVGIPFCPTRCSYCSFASNPFSEEGSKEYLRALFYEISRIGSIINRNAMYAESVYIGGGTPTSLSEGDFEKLMEAVSSTFVSERTREFSVEAGRPDTITPAKLRAIRGYGAGRVSVNPQSMKQRTLDLIGRSHRTEDIYSAYEMVREAGIPCVNMDLIAGLPEESPEDFADTLGKVIALDPENVTVHTLAVKRASRLIEEDAEYSYRSAETVRAMLSGCGETMREAGYRPYYVYRQKQMAGNLENTGWSKPGFESLYNVRIMEEDQTILACGAGAISKRVGADGKIVRAANVTNYRIYIDRIDEMIERKENLLR